SEFAVTQILVVLFAALYVFFVSVMAGTVILKDDELKVGEVLHSTRLTPAEYVWGKFGAVILTVVLLLAIHIRGAILFNHASRHGKNADSIGRFVPGNYLWPALVFFLPNLILFAGLCFAVGTLTRQPVLVFALPIFVLISGLAFFWQWSPEWLPLWINRL